MRSHIALPVALALLLAVAGCGDDSDEDATAASGADATTTVSVQSIDGMGDVLVDSEGAALYTADEESDGRVRCTDECASTWIPLTLSDGDQPSGADEVSGQLDVVRRPGGGRQVAFDGQPLYRFADDPMPGEVTGDGLADEFGGELFTWQVATADGSAAGEAPTPVSPY
jgi:predicted lipoprotein with Yx(FWY)xxD motif